MRVAVAVVLLCTVCCVLCVAVLVVVWLLCVYCSLFKTSSPYSEGFHDAHALPFASPFE